MQTGVGGDIGIAASISATKRAPESMASWHGEGIACVGVREFCSVHLEARQKTRAAPLERRGQRQCQRHPRQHQNSQQPTHPTARGAPNQTLCAPNCKSTSPPPPNPTPPHPLPFPALHSPTSFLIHTSAAQQLKSHAHQILNLHFPHPHLCNAATQTSCTPNPQISTCQPHPTPPSHVLHPPAASPIHTSAAQQREADAHLIPKPQAHPTPFPPYTQPPPISSPHTHRQLPHPHLLQLPRQRQQPHWRRAAGRGAGARQEGQRRAVPYADPKTREV